MLRAAVNTEPALTRADLISELAASNSPLRIADAELIVVTIFDQIAWLAAYRRDGFGEGEDGAVLQGGQ